jgi:hypothetical protein
VFPEGGLPALSFRAADEGRPEQFVHDLFGDAECGAVPSTETTQTYAELADAEIRAACGAPPSRGLPPVFRLGRVYGKRTRPSVTLQRSVTRAGDPADEQLT